MADLLEKAANIGDADSARSLMNLVMQFRKVCNHPELFERADVVAPFSFSDFGRSGPLNREGDLIQLPYSTRNPIELTVPKLLYHEGFLDVPREEGRSAVDTRHVANLMNIWSTDWIHRSLLDEGVLPSRPLISVWLNSIIAQSAFTFLKLLDLTPSDAHKIHDSSLIQRTLEAIRQEEEQFEDEPYIS